MQGSNATVTTATVTNYFNLPVMTLHRQFCVTCPSQKELMQKDQVWQETGSYGKQSSADMPGGDTDLTHVIHVETHPVHPLVPGIERGVGIIIHVHPPIVISVQGVPFCCAIHN